MAVVFCVALTGCVERWTERLREQCEKEARTIVYDREVWDRYREMIMAKRRANPGGEWSLSVYRSRFRSDYVFSPGIPSESRDGEIYSIDKLVSYDGKEVFRFIGFGFGYSALTHRKGSSCFGLTPELYLERFDNA